MKIASVPVEVAFAEPDYRNYDPDVEKKREQEHQEILKHYLISIGYNGKHTGRIYRTPVADGYAMYMMADGGRNSYLIHLPYGDAYYDRDVQYIPKAEIIKRLDSQERMNQFFAKQREKQTA